MVLVALRAISWYWSLQHASGTLVSLVHGLCVDVLDVIDDNASLFVLRRLGEGRGSSNAGRVGRSVSDHSCRGAAGRIGGSRVAAGRVDSGRRARSRGGGSSFLGGRGSSGRGGRSSGRGGRDDGRAGGAGRSSAERCGSVNLANDPRGSLLGVELEVVEVFGYDTAASADWVAGSAVVTEDRRVAVEKREVSGAARVGLLAGAIEYVVGLVGGVHDVAPEERGSDGLASGRGVVDAVGDFCAATGSTENVTHNVSALRVAVDHDVGAWALLVEGSDLSDTVASTLSDLRAVVGSESNIVLDLNVVAGFALSSQLGAGGIAEGRCATVVVGGIVATSHEDDYIGTGCIELGSCSLGGSEGREGANGEGVTDERHIKY